MRIESMVKTGLFFAAIAAVVLQSNMVDYKSVSGAINISEKIKESTEVMAKNPTSPASESIGTEGINEVIHTHYSKSKPEGEVIPNDKVSTKVDQADLLGRKDDGESVYFSSIEPDKFFHGSYAIEIDEGGHPGILIFVFDGKGGIKKEIGRVNGSKLLGSAKYKFNGDRMMYYDVKGDEKFFPGDGEEFISSSDFMQIEYNGDQVRLIFQETGELP